MFTIFRFLVTFVGLLIAMICLSTTTNAVVPVTEDIMLTNAKTGKCLTIAGGTLSDNGVPAVQYDCDDDPSRRWRLSDAGGNSYRIKNVKTGKCLAVEGDSDQNNVRTIQFDCDDQASRVWRLTEISGTYQIRNVRTDKCATIAGGVSSDNNVESVQYICDNDVSRRWTIKSGSVAASPPAPPPAKAPPTPSYRTSGWSNWARAEGVQYRYQSGWNPQDSKQIDAIYQIKNLQNSVWHGAARSVDCSTNTLSGSTSVDLQPGETREVRFKTPNCGSASDAFFKPSVVQSKIY